MEENNQNPELNQTRCQRIKDSSWFILAVAFLVVIIGIVVLSWQYHKIAEKEIPSLKETIEENNAQNVLEKFMQYRIEGNENQALIYLTENAVAQREQGKFQLINQFESFEIINSQKTDENSYRFAVRIKGEKNNYEVIESIKIIKFLELNKYYIDSVELAG